MLALKTGKQTVTRLAFSADGARLAAAGTGRKVHLWDLTAKKRKPALLPTFKAPIEWLGFRPDGRLFAVSKMGQYAVHDPATGRTDSHALRDWWVGPLVASADGSAFYGTGWQARKWTFDGRLREAWAQEVPGELIAGRGGAVLTPEGALVAAVCNGDDKTWLHARDAATGEFRSEHLVARSLIRDLTLLPDGRTFVFVRERQYKGLAANAVLVGTLGAKFEVLLKPKASQAEFTALALHPSGKWLAVGSEDGTVRTFDTAGWREATAHTWPVEPVAGLAFAPDGLKAAAGGNEGQVVVWDVDL